MEEGDLKELRYKEIENNKEINAYLKKGDANLGQLGFTSTKDCPMSIFIHKIIQSEGPVSHTI